MRSHLESGQFTLGDEISPNLFLQLFWGEWFCRLGGGFSFTWLRLSTLVLAWAATLCIYGLLRLGGGKRKPAFWGALLFGFSPVFFSLSYTFMTDVPFLAATLGSILAFSLFLKSRRPGYRIAGYILALAAYLMRLPGIFIIPAFEVALWVATDDKRQALRWVGAGLIVSTGFFVLMEQWIKPTLGLSPATTIGSDLFTERHLSEPGRNILQFFKNILRGLFITGLFCLPLTPQVWKASAKAGLLRPRILGVAVLFTVGLTGVLYRMGMVFPFSEGGNIFYNFGLGPPLLYDWHVLGMDFPLRLPGLLMAGLGIWAELLGLLLLLLMVVRIRSHSRLSPFFTFLFILNAAYLLLLGLYSYHDRYFLLPFASMLIWLLPERPLSFPLRTNLILITVTACFSITTTHDYLAWNRSVHQLAGRWAQQGVAPVNIDGGVAYNGWHKGETRNPSAKKIIAFQPIPDYQVADSSIYLTWLFGRKQHIWMLQNGTTEIQHEGSSSDSAE